MKNNNVTFRFIRFNQRRAQRGADAAEIEIIEDGVPLGCLWMSFADIKLNIKEHGDSPALTEALNQYTAP